MKFSLIVSTVGRTEELKRLLNSLSSQTQRDFEVIISDQNIDDRISDLLLEGKWNLTINHIRSKRGLSRARNTGLNYAKGELISFPDDDCTYTPDLLDRVASYFDAHPEYGYMTGSTYDNDGKSFTRASSEPAPIQRLRIYRQGVEFTYFFRSSCFNNQRFDENMGIGCDTPWQADEGPDLLLQLEEKGIRGYYQPAIAIWHPAKAGTDAPDIDKCYRYACGCGYFLRKHQFPIWYFGYMQARTLAGIAVGLLRFNLGITRFHGARWRGRWRGWLGYPTFQKQIPQ